MEITESLVEADLKAANFQSKSIVWSASALLKLNVDHKYVLV